MKRTIPSSPAMLGAVVSVCIGTPLITAGIAVADPPQGAIVGWGRQFVGADLSSGFLAECQ